MSALRVYVAGASAEVDMVAEFIRRLRETGVVITYDWTPDVMANGGAAEPTVPVADRQRMLSADLAGGVGNGPFLPNDSAYLQRRFRHHHLAGVAASDLVWLLVPEGVTIGAWAELGYAIGLGIPVLASGPHSRRTIFTEFCAHAATHEEAFRYLVDSARAAIWVKS